MASQTDRLQATREAQLTSQRTQLERSKRLQVSQEARRKGKAPERIIQEEKVEQAQKELETKRKQSAQEVSEKLKKAGTVQQIEKVYSELPEEVRKYVTVTPSKVKQQLKEREKKIDEEIKKAQEKVDRYREKEREADSQRREDRYEERLDYYKDYKKGLQQGKSRLQKGQLLSEKDIKDYADDLGDVARDKAYNRNIRNRQKREYKSQGLTELPSGKFVDLEKLGFSDSFAGKTLSKTQQRNLGIEVTDEGISRDLSKTYSKGALADLTQRFAQEAKTIQKEKGVSFKEAQKLARKQTQLGGIPQGFEIELQKQEVKKEQKKLGKTFDFDVPERTEIKGDISQFDSAADFTAPTKRTKTTPTRTVEELQKEAKRKEKRDVTGDFTLFTADLERLQETARDTQKIQSLTEGVNEINLKINKKIEEIKEEGAIVIQDGQTFEVSGIESLSESKRKEVRKKLSEIKELEKRSEKKRQTLTDVKPKLTFFGEDISREAVAGFGLLGQKEISFKGQAIAQEDVLTTPFDITGEVLGISGQKALEATGFGGITTIEKGQEFEIFEPRFGTLGVDPITGKPKKAVKKRTITAEEDRKIFTPEQVGSGIETTFDIGKFAVPVVGTTLATSVFTGGLARADFDPIRFAKEEPFEVAGLATFGALKLKGLKKARRASKIDELTKTQPELTIGITRRGDDFTDVLVAGKRAGKGARSETLQKFRLSKVDDTISRIEAGKSTQKTFTDSLLFSDSKLDVQDLTFFGKVRKTKGRKVKQFGDDLKGLTKGDDITGATFAESKINVLDDLLKSTTVRGGGLSRKKGKFTEFITGKLDDLDEVGKARLRPSGLGVIKRTDEDVISRVSLQPGKTSQVAPTDINKILGQPTKRLDLGKTIDDGAFARSNIKRLDEQLSKGGKGGKVTKQISKIDETDIATTFSTVEQEALEQTAKSVMKGAGRTNLLAGFTLGVQEADLTKVKPAVGLADASVLGKVTKTKTKPLFKTKDITQQVELKSTDFAELQDTSFKFDTAQAIDTSTIKKSTTITDTPTITVPDITITPETTTEIKPPWPKLDFGRGISKVSKDKGVYDVYTKRAGKRVKLTEEPLPRERALDVGSYITDHSIAAQFSIKKTKEKRKVAKKPQQKMFFGQVQRQFNTPDNYWKLQGRGKFRDYKKVKGSRKKLRNTWIEQDNLRLDTAGEVNKITAKRLASSSKKASVNLGKSQKNLAKAFGL